MWARRVRLRLSLAKGYPRLGLPTQGFNWPSGCTFFIPRSIKGCLRLGLPTQGFNRPSRHAFMFKGTCQQVMVIITYRSTALSESDFSICNAIGVKMGMQKKKWRQVSTIILPQILQGIVSRPILYPQWSRQSVGAKRGLAAMPMCVRRQLHCWARGP